MVGGPDAMHLGNWTLWEVQRRPEFVRHPAGIQIFMFSVGIDPDVIEYAKRQTGTWEFAKIRGPTVETKCEDPCYLLSGLQKRCPSFLETATSENHT